MNKSQSKYFNTATRMDQALLELLEKKDIGYITIKEICKTAGVNRSTFYLHYENISDLLTETIQYLNEQFCAHMGSQASSFVSKIQECSLDELYLVTPAYLIPYLEYVKQNKRLFRAALKDPGFLRSDKTYRRMMEHVFLPILKRLQIPETNQKYMLAFYMNGLIAILSEWLRSNCEDPIEHICAIMEECVMRGRGGQEESK